MEVLSVLFAFAENSKFSGLRPTAVVEPSVDTGSDESRGGGRGEKAMIAEKLSGEK